MPSASKIPEHWTARMFAKMLAIWGDAFTRKWVGVDVDEWKATWAQGLADQNEAALRRGMAALMHEKYPPDLPRFRELCRAASVIYTPPSITHEHRITEDGDVSLANVRALLAKHALPKSEVPVHMTGIEWASKIIREANETSGQVNLIRFAHAQASLHTWCTLHHCLPEDLDEFGKWKHGTRYAVPVDEAPPLPPLVPSPHIYREPGEDDE